MNQVDPHTYLLLAAIDRAGEVHGRVPDWETIKIMVQGAIDDGHLDRRDYDGPNGQELRMAKIVEIGFLSLEIDLSGNPNPGKLPWEEQIKVELQSEKQ